MKEIERALRERVGLDSASVGSSVIQRSVRLRMKSRGIKKMEDYLRLLLSSSNEWTALTESVVVAETWFFRDVEPFNALVRLVLQWLPSHPRRRVRLLSLPCSSGEEPYSLAMGLLDAGVAPEQLEIDAVDISARALSRARTGIYGKNSFRVSNLEFRKKYFRSIPGGFSLDPSILKLVRFSEGNVLADNFQPPNSTYDFIFCRNLLIYFDGANQNKALGRIHDLLASDGFLFVGAAEQPLVFDKGFVSAHLAMAFACRKGATASKEASYKTDARMETASPPQSDSEIDANGVKNEIGPQIDLEMARRLADEGHLREAATICEAHLKNSEPSAQAYYLMGLVRDASGDVEAADFYRKALYLDPNHYESLLQMALWFQKNGETAMARRFKNRAERAKSYQTKS